MHLAGSTHGNAAGVSLVISGQIIVFYSHTWRFYETAFKDYIKNLSHAFYLLKRTILIISYPKF
jgi:hypothetical protein